MNAQPSPADRHNAHMQAVRAIQRRNHYERCCLKIATFMEWERQAQARNTRGLSDHEREQLLILVQMRDELRAEMEKAGQQP